jgi:uncharacterized membrane protein
MLQEEGAIVLDDMVVVSRGISNNLDIKQTHTATGKTAAKGSGIGLLAGLLLGGPILGLAAGAAVGAITGSMKDLGIDDKFIEKVSASLKPQSSAIFLLVKEANGPRVLEELAKFEGVVLTTDLEPEQQKRLEKALSK